MFDQRPATPMEEDAAARVNKYIPPWREPYVIAMAGSSGSGKTSIAQSIIKELNVPWTILLSMDNFYRPLTTEQKRLAFQSQYDFDSPRAIDLDLFAQVLGDLKAGRRTRIPTYSFAEHDRTDRWIPVYGANIIIFEGIYALYDPRVLALTDLKVFIDTPLDICLARRLARDIVHRDRSIALSVEQWSRFVKPNFEQHMRFTMYNSDLRIPRGMKNTVVIDLLTSHIRRKLQSKSNQHLENLLSLKNGSPVETLPGERKNSDSSISDDSIISLPCPNNLKILDPTPQAKAMHSIILDGNTSRLDFEFYFNRMGVILLNRALDELGNDFYQSLNNIITPTGCKVHDGIRPTGTIASVFMISGGGCFDASLRKVLGSDGRANSNGFNGFTNGGIGRILIQSDINTGEPHLHTLSLPPCIDPRQTHEGTLNSSDCLAQAVTKVLLLDTQLASGVAITMAVSILVDHGIQEENIIVVAYLTSHLAVTRILAAFPKVTIVVARCESKIYPKFIDPRYYGTP